MRRNWGDKDEYANRRWAFWPRPHRPSGLSVLRQPAACSPPKNESAILSGRRRAVTRQCYDERGAFAHLGLYFDRAAVILHDAIADREPQTRSLTGRFGCEERIENLVANRRRNSLPVVRHFDTDRSV